MQSDFERNVPFRCRTFALDLYAAGSGGIRRCLLGGPAVLADAARRSCWRTSSATTWRRCITAWTASLPYFLPSPVPGNVRRVHPRALADLLQAGAVRYRSGGAAGGVRFPAAGAGDRAGVFEGDSRNRASGACAVRRAGPAMADGAADLPGRDAPPISICIRWRARRGCGMFATALNLLPIGQLDGGHILYSFFPRRHRLISKISGRGAVADGRVLVRRGWCGAWCCSGWAAASGDLRRSRSWARAGGSWAGLALAIFLLCFTSAPIGDGGHLSRA